MGQYIQQDSLLAVYGQRNLVRWSNFDEAARVIDAGRLNAAIAWAEATCNNRLTDGPYVVPITPTGTSLSQDVLDALARLAGWWLWDSRKLHNTEAVVIEMSRDKKQALQLMDDVLSGRLPIPAVLKDKTTSVNVPFLAGW